MVNRKEQRGAVGTKGVATYSSADIAEWNVEDEAFWESKGKAIANRNLWISIPSLLCGFAIWLMWGIITVQMLNLGFPFKPQELFTLTAISGLMGATYRIPASFFIRLCGGRNTIFLTTALLMLPAIGAYGGFFIPMSYGIAISMFGGPAYALYLFIVFYVTCIAMTWWYYARRNAEAPC